MPTFLQAMAAVKAARELHEAAQKAAKADPSNLTKATAAKGAAAGLTAAYASAITAAAGQPALTKQRDELIEAKVIHHEKYEKKTVETADPPPETAPSQEEEPSSSGALSAEEGGEEEGAKGGEEPKAPMRERKGSSKKASDDEGDEEAEEKAIAAAYGRAMSSYKREMRGQNVDAYGRLYGPEALLAACMKALGTGSIRETFGALSQLPERLAATSTIVKTVEKLEKRDRASRAAKAIDAAKADGVPMTKDRRTELLKLADAHGVSHLKGVLAMMPRLPTQPIDAAEDGNDARGLVQGGDAQQERAIEHFHDPR
jgi:hypothetical protein